MKMKIQNHDIRPAKRGRRVTQASDSVPFHFQYHWDRNGGILCNEPDIWYMMDMLLDILRRNRSLNPFMDSQTVPLQDYLEIRPEKGVW